MNVGILSILLGAVWILVLILLGFLVVTGLSLAPWLPIHRRDIRRVLTISDLKPGEVFVELGSGTGGMTIAAASVKEVRARGVELAPVLWFVSTLRSRLFHRGRARFVLGNLYKHDISDADVVYVFGMPRTVPALVQKLLTDCRPGTRIISYVFKIDGLPQVRVDKPDEKSASIYVYEIPDRIPDRYDHQI